MKKVKNKKLKLRVLAFAMAAVLLAAMIPFSVFASGDTKDVTIATLSDIHYYAESLKGNRSQAYLDAVAGAATTFDLAADAVDAALSSLSVHLSENEQSYLILPGDLTAQGEYESHAELAAKLEAFEEKSGVDVLVINGNHDINNYKASTYENDIKEDAQGTAPEDFRNIYANLGYDLAYHTYTPANGKAGMLSYSVRLPEGYRLILMDTNCYSADATKDGTDEHETRGVMSDGLWKWVLAEMEDAKKCGEEIIGVNHCGVVDHLGSYEEKIFGAFVLENWEYYAGELADNGMHYVFTGHQHSADIASYVSDNGETIYDCETPPAATYPCGMYETEFSADANGKISAKYNYFDIDCETPVILHGVEQEQPFKYQAFRYAYSNNDLAQLGVNIVNMNILPIFKQIQEAGGIIEYADSLGYNLEAIIKDYFSGLSVAGIDIFTSKNIMGLVENLCDQIMEVYIKNPEHLNEFVGSLFSKLANFQVTDTPCTKFIDTFGFGSKDRPGNLGEAALSVVSYLFGGNEDIRDDQYMQDVIAAFRDDTDASRRLVQFLIDLILEDVLENELFANLNLNIGTLFPEGQIGHFLGQMLDCLFNAILKGDTSFQNIIDFVFSLGILPYDGLRDILDGYMEEYFTESQYQTIGLEIANILDTFCNDANPEFLGDKNVTYTYSGKTDVPVTQENYRAPSLIAVTFGDNSASSYNISWYTKNTVTGTDIEIIPYSENPKFTGKPTTGANISASCKKTVRTFPGIDFGVIGIMNVEKEYNRHIIKLTGLEAGTKYAYRIGDAARGWWSDTGVLETANGSDKTTFFHMSDCQSGSEIQYNVWKNVVDQAFKLFPDSKFILNTGDLVDQGDNLKQWNWVLGSAKEHLMNTALMPASGNHENYGTNALALNFVLPNMPAQNTESGVYYSFDYNNAHIAVLNSNDLDQNEALSKEQIDWLKKDMSASSADWKFVALHKAVYSNGSHYDDDDVIAIRKQLAALMPELDIDIVFQGHDHVYLRTDVMDNNEVNAPQTKTVEYNGRTYTAKLDPAGSIYVISACSGVKYYLTKDASLTDKLFPRAESIVDCTLPVFSAVQIDGDTLYFDAFTVDGTKTDRIDSFAISKAETPAEPVDPDEPATDVTNEPTTDAAGTSETTNGTDTTDSESPTANTDSETDADSGDDIVQTGHSTAIAALVILPLSIGAFMLTRKKKED